MAHHDKRKEFKVSLVPPPGMDDTALRKFISEALTAFASLSSGPPGQLDTSRIRVARAYR